MLEKKISLFTNNKGNEFLTQLEATLELSDKLDSVVEAVKAIPQTVIPDTVIPEQKDVVFPDVQKVEITNLPTGKDDKEQLALLKEISEVLKKKEQLAYDIKIDATLKEQLKGERGADGANGKDGKDAVPTDIVAELESLEGEDRLDVSAVKGTEELIDEIATKIAKREVKKVKPNVMMYSGGSSSSSSSTVVIATGATDPATASEGELFINTTDNGYKVYYGGTWQTLHTLTPASVSYWLQEDGSFFLQEDGVSKFVLQ